MITSETMEVVQANFCVINLEANGATNGWTMKATQVVTEPSRFASNRHSFIGFKDVKFEGKTIADCFAQAREHINLSGG